MTCSKQSMRFNGSDLCCCRCPDCVEVEGLYEGSRGWAGILGGRVGCVEGRAGLCLPVTVWKPKTVISSLFGK